MNKIPVKAEVVFADCKIIEEQVVDEKTGDKIMVVEAKWQHAGIVNTNQRRYRPEILKREIENLQSAISENRIYGASYHPHSGHAEVDDVSHLWQRAWMNEKTGECFGQAKILPTARGKNAQVLIKHGGRIGISSRGYGTTTMKEEVIEGKRIAFNDVNDDFKLVSPGDFVLTPSVPGAEVKKLIEKIESQFEGIEDSTHLKGEEKMSEIKDLESLRKEHPDLVKQAEEEARKAVQTEAEKELQTKIDAAIEAKKEEIKKAIETDLQPQIAAATKAKEEAFDVIRGVITSLSQIPDVIPVEEGTPPDPKVKKDDATPVGDAKTAERLEALEKQNKTLQETLDNIKKAEDQKKADVEKQTKLKEALDEELKKEDYKTFETLIRKELVTEEGKILIEEVDAVAQKVLDAKTKVSSTLAEAQKLNIIANIDPKGKVDPEGEPKKKLTEDEIVTRWEKARTSGSTLSLEEYKEKVLGLKE